MARKRKAKDLVDACGYSILDLFQMKPFSLDYFQREYVWEEAQVERLITDLSKKFLDQWDQADSPQDVAQYDPYFLGPFIVYSEDDKSFLADGQQRIITLLLLLVFLRRLMAQGAGANGNSSLLSTLIVTEQFGRRIFSVDVDEYSECFAALLYGREFNMDDAPPNVRRVWEAYQHIGAHYPYELRGETLSLFVDWLLHRVSLIAMDAGDHERAVEMFQSMNDRGVHLSPMDHLKRYLLGDAESDPRELEGKWTTMLSALEKAERGAAFAYLRTVLRARFPEAAKRPGPSLADATHEWVRAHQNELWPMRGDRARFFTEILFPLHNTYASLLQARTRIDPDLRAVRFNTVNGITEQFDLTFAALQPDDSQKIRRSKAAMVANFLDLFYVTQTLDDEPAEQKNIDELVHEVMPAVLLTRSEGDLRRALGEHAADWPDRLGRIPDLRYDTEKKFVHYILARLTAWVEVGAGREDPTDRFLARRPGERDFEIEHLFTSTASKYEQMVPDPHYYGYLRNRIGALLLLDGLDNGSYGGMLLADKLKHYRNDTLLAGMLNPDFLDRGNVRLRRFLRDQGLRNLVSTYDGNTALEPFIDARGRFYHQIAKRIWSLEKLGLAQPTLSGQTPVKKRTHHGIRVADLVNAGFVRADDRLVGYRKGRPYYARVLADGRIQTESGSISAAPTAAMMEALGVASNGWAFWQVDRTKERLDAVRQRYLEGAGT